MDTGWAAPMCVPGAIAATSAASMSRKPADAARAPPGATNTAIGVRAASIAADDRLRRVDQPAGRAEREDEQRRRRSASARSMAETMNSAVTGWMMLSTSAA